MHGGRAKTAARSPTYTSDRQQQQQQFVFVIKAWWTTTITLFSLLYMPSEQDSLLPANGGHHHSNNDSRTASSWIKDVRRRLDEKVDPKACDAPLLWQCVVAGAADAVSFSQTGTWVGFMTGNITQLTIAATTLVVEHPDAPSGSLDRVILSSTALIGFMLGCLLTAFVDSRFHGQHRGKLCATALGRAVLFASLIPWIYIHGWQGNAIRVLLFLMALNMGSMAVSALRLGTTPFSTTVVFTSTLASLSSDHLLPFGLSSASQKRALSVLALIVGGAASQSVILLSQRWTHSSSFTSSSNPTIGCASALGLTAIFELICAVSWYNAKSALQNDA